MRRKILFDLLIELSSELWNGDIERDQLQSLFSIQPPFAINFQLTLLT